MLYICSVFSIYVWNVLVCMSWFRGLCQLYIYIYIYIYNPINEGIFNIYCLRIKGLRSYLLQIPKLVELHNRIHVDQ